MSKPIRIITLDLLRKRSEHNEGLVSSLEELALHQEELQSIGPILGRTCGKTLKILLLQNNVINRMVPSELKLFRSLEYLNLALNNISKIEGLRNMEFLRKLDLTLNFINLDSLEESIDELVECRSLVELFLLGNPCMGLNVDNDDMSAVDNASSKEGGADDEPQKQVGWRGCRAYVIARLPTLQFLDGKEIKRSERILAMQQLPALTNELHTLAEDVRQKKKHQVDIVQDADDNESSSEYIADDATTEHNPATRTKMSNELYDQKQAKEKEQNANAPPKPKGEKEWEEEHANTVQKVREKEEQSREVKRSNAAEDETGNITKKDGGIKQCNQGKYQFWFEEEASTNKESLIMRVAIPKYLSTSLIDVDIHPTYVSVVIKSKILRVILPVEVQSSQAVARRSQASGYLELVMPKADPNELVIGLLHVRDNTSKNRKAMKELDGVCNTSSTAKGLTCNTGKTTTLKKKERLGESIMKEVGVAESLKIVQSKVPDDSANNSDDDDEPPPLF